MQASLLVGLLSVFLFAPTLAEPSVKRALDINSEPTPDNICGLIVDQSLNNDTVWFYAEDAIDCLRSVPFHPAPANRFIEYLRQTLQYHATTAYVRSPPAEYQQPPIDLLGSLDDIQSRVGTGVYHNQYAFEVDVLRLLQKCHDTHLFVIAGATAPWIFSSPYDLVSVSSDGKQAPEVYLYEDLKKQVTQKNPPYTASPISTINGQPVVDFLTRFASAHSYGMLEPHADWNQLMMSPALEITDTANSFSGATQYFDEDDYNLDLVFKDQNRQNESGPWVAYFNTGFTGPLTTGGDFYNYFALGNLPANFEEEQQKYNARNNLSDSTSTQNQTNMTSWNQKSAAYPAHPLVFQDDLGSLDSSGYLTGYFLEDVSTAVLSLPSFLRDNTTEQSLRRTAQSFIGNATEKGAKKVIIDLQQNTGGDVDWAIECFRYFFPKTDPFLGSRIRSHPQANILGGALTSMFQTLAPNSSDDIFQRAVQEEWVVTDRINAETGRNFTSWAEYYGPIQMNGDQFSRIQQYNLSDRAFTDLAFNTQLPDCFYQGNCEKKQSWAAENIVLLTDGMCSSACALFVEMMQQMDVRTVVMGGRPEPGPMQAASGSRGAAVYSGLNLDYDFSLAQNLSGPAASQLDPIRDSGLLLSFASFTLRDSMKRNASLPTQMTYIPADCRLYWTVANFYDYDRLWHDVSRAIFNDTSMCVPGSTNVKTAPRRPDSPTVLRPFPAQSKSENSPAKYIAQGLDLDFADKQHSLGIEDRRQTALSERQCKEAQQCTPGHSCVNGKCAERMVLPATAGKSRSHLPNLHRGGGGK